jgi:hypothetical protein|eukprot:COSAG06_NODE_656_length_13333_cov_6.485492_8_plen_322_part_00
MSSGRSPIISTMAILSGPVTLYMREPSDSPARADGGGEALTSSHAPAARDWSAAGMLASSIEAVAALDRGTLLCVMGCAGLAVALLLYRSCSRKAQQPSAGGDGDGTSSAAGGGPAALATAGEEVVVLDCVCPDTKRRVWPGLFAKDKLVHHIEVNTMGELVELSAALEHALPEGVGDIGAVVVIEPWCLFKANQVSSLDQIGVSRYVENTVRGLRKFAESFGVTADHDVPIPVLGCSVEYGLLQLSQPTMCGFVPPSWVHTEDDSLLKGFRPLPQAARSAMETVAAEWRRGVQVSKEKQAKMEKQDKKKMEKQSKKNKTL